MDWMRIRFAVRPASSCRRLAGVQIVLLVLTDRLHLVRLIRHWPRFGRFAVSTRHRILLSIRIAEGSLWEWELRNPLPRERRDA